MGLLDTPQSSRTKLHVYTGEEEGRGVLTTLTPLPTPRRRTPEGITENHLFPISSHITVFRRAFALAGA